MALQEHRSIICIYVSLEQGNNIVLRSQVAPMKTISLVLVLVLLETVTGVWMSYEEFFRQTHHLGANLVKMKHNCAKGYAQLAPGVCRPRRSGQ